MNRKGEDGGVGGKNLRRAISLVDVAIDGHRPLDGSFLLQAPDGDSDVVQNAESLAVVGESVVEASAHVDGDVALERQASGQD